MCHISREIVLYHDTKHALISILVVEERFSFFGDGMFEAHSVTADAPMMLRQCVLKVDIVIGETSLRIEHSGDDWQTVLLSIVHDGEARLA